MTRRHRRAANHLRIESLAGWVFADVLLVLFIIGLGTQVTTVTRAEEPPEGKPAVAKPAPPKPAIKIGMKEDPVFVYVDADVAGVLGPAGPKKNAATLALRNDIAKKTAGLQREQGALTLIWGCTETTAAGMELARAAGGQMELARPTTFTGARERPLWDGGCKKGEDVRLEIYLYNTKPASG